MEKASSIFRKVDSKEVAKEGIKAEEVMEQMEKAARDMVKVAFKETVSGAASSGIRSGTAPTRISTCSTSAIRSRRQRVQELTT